MVWPPPGAWPATETKGKRTRELLKLPQEVENVTPSSISLVGASHMVTPDFKKDGARDPTGALKQRGGVFVSSPKAHNQDGGILTYVARNSVCS